MAKGIGLIGAHDEIARDVSARDRKRFMGRIKHVGDCWVFCDTPNRPYGMFVIGGRAMVAHRFSKLMFHGFIETKLYACHTCRTKKCVNPQHIVWQTATQNAQDMFRDGTFVRPRGFVPKISARQAVLAFKAYHQEGDSMNSIARRLGVSSGAIYSIVHQRTHRAETSHMRKRPATFDGSTVRRGANHRNTTLTDSDVLDIRQALLDGAVPKDLREKYKLSASGLTAIKKGRNWKHLLPHDDKARQVYLAQFQERRIYSCKNL